MSIKIPGLKDLKQDIQSFLGELKNYDSVKAKTKACKTRLPELEQRTGSLCREIRDLKETTQNQIDSRSQEEALSEVKAASITLSALRLLLLRGGLIERPISGKLKELHIKQEEILNRVNITEKENTDKKSLLRVQHAHELTDLIRQIENLRKRIATQGRETEHALCKNPSDEEIPRKHRAFCIADAYLQTQETKLEAILKQFLKN